MTADGHGAHLVVDGIVDGRLVGWAHAPGAVSDLQISVDGDVLTSWPRTRARPDADRAMNEYETTKGFAIPVAPLHALNALARGRGRRPRLSLRFAGARLAIPTGVPSRTMETFGDLIEDAWLSDAAHLRLRLSPRVIALQMAQFVRRLACERRTVPPSGLLTVRLHDPRAPLVLVFDVDGERVLDGIAFPSLLRGGAHEAEALAATNGADELPAYAGVLARALGSDRPRPPPPFGNAVDRLIGRLAATLPQVSAGRLQSAITATLASEAFPTNGFVAHDPSPGGESWLVRPALVSADEPFDPAPGDPRRDCAGAEPLLPRAIVRGVRADRGLDPYLFPATPERVLPDPPAFRVVVYPGEVDAEPLRQSLPDAAILEGSNAPVTFGALAEDRPILFADPHLFAHDKRVFAGLLTLLDRTGAASVGCAAVSEPSPTDRAAFDRFVLGGLFPRTDPASAPWRAPFQRLRAAGPLDGATYRVALNDPAFVVVSAPTVRQHADHEATVCAAGVMALLVRAAATGETHVATNLFSVFDRGSALAKMPFAAEWSAPLPPHTALIRLR